MHVDICSSCSCADINAGLSEACCFLTITEDEDEDVSSSNSSHSSLSESDPTRSLPLLFPPLSAIVLARAAAFAAAFEAPLKQPP